MSNNFSTAIAERRSCFLSPFVDVFVAPRFLLFQKRCNYNNFTLSKIADEDFSLYTPKNCVITLPNEGTVLPSYGTDHSLINDCVDCTVVVVYPWFVLLAQLKIKPISDRVGRNILSRGWLTWSVRCSVSASWLSYWVWIKQTFVLIIVFCGKNFICFDCCIEMVSFTGSSTVLTS